MDPENMRNEGHVKDAVTKQMTAVGAWWVMHVPVGYGKQGVPDFVVCINGRLVGIETKFRTNTMSPHQLRELKAIVQAGGIGLAVNEKGLEDLWKILQITESQPWSFTSGSWQNLCWDRRGNLVQHEGRKSNG